MISEGPFNYQIPILVFANANTFCSVGYAFFILQALLKYLLTTFSPGVEHKEEGRKQGEEGRQEAES